MTQTGIYLKHSSEKKATFRERSHCISCGSDKLHPIWQGRFSDEPTRSFIESCHYSGDALAQLGEEHFSLVRCDCGMVFHQKILTPQYLNLLYSEWINEDQIKHMEAHYRVGSKQKVLFERGRQSTIHFLRLKKLLVSNETEGIRILDYGCGDGHFLALAKLFGFDTYGIDFSSIRNEQSAKMGISIFNNLEALENRRIPKMHTVTLFQVLEHLEEPLTILKKIANVMEDGGILIVEVPDCRGIKQPQDFFEFHFVQPLEHINAFTPTSLKRMCISAGFVAIKRIPAHVTTSFVDISHEQVSSFLQRSKTAQYFRLRKSLIQ